MSRLKVGRSDLLSYGSIYGVVPRDRTGLDRPRSTQAPLPVGLHILAAVTGSDACITAHYGFPATALSYPITAGLAGRHTQQLGGPEGARIPQPQR